MRKVVPNLALLEIIYYYDLKNALINSISIYIKKFTLEICIIILCIVRSGARWSSDKHISFFYRHNIYIYILTCEFLNKTD